MSFCYVLKIFFIFESKIHFHWVHFVDFQENLLDIGHQQEISSRTVTDGKINCFLLQFITTFIQCTSFSLFHSESSTKSDKDSSETGKHLISM